MHVFYHNIKSLLSICNDKYKCLGAQIFVLILGEYYFLLIFETGFGYEFLGLGIRKVVQGGLGLQPFQLTLPGTGITGLQNYAR